MEVSQEGDRYMCVDTYAHDCDQHLITLYKFTLLLLLWSIDQMIMGYSII